MENEEIMKENAFQVLKMLDSEKGKQIVEKVLTTENSKVTEIRPEIIKSIEQGFSYLLKLSSDIGNKIEDTRRKIVDILCNPENTPGDQLKEESMNELISYILNNIIEEKKLLSGEVQEIIQQSNYKKPKNILMPTAKVVHKLYDGVTDFTDGIQPVDVGPKKQKGKFIIPVEIFMSATPNEELAVQKKLTPFDRQVQNGIATLIENGYNVFTAKQVYEAFAGKSTTSPQAIGHVTRSINKQRTTLISIDWTAHAKMNGLQIDENRGEYIATEENLMLLRRVRLSCNGQEVEGYSVIEPPVLYRYAKTVGQLSTIDRKLLNVPISNTETNIILKNELLERIDSIKKRKNMSNTITFDTLYKLVGISDNRKEKERLRNAVDVMLNYWKEENFILDYSLNKTKQKITSITIKFLNVQINEEICQ